MGGCLRPPIGAEEVKGNGRALMPLSEAEEVKGNGRALMPRTEAKETAVCRRGAIVSLRFILKRPEKGGCQEASASWHLL